MNYWLMKSEPGDYSIDDLKREKRAMWDGVRNYQARNYMRDDMQIGDRVIFYHSNANPPHIAGLAEVASEPYDDPTQFDKKDSHYDPKSKQEKPTWQLVDVKYVSKCSKPIPLEEIKSDKELSKMVVAQKGSRLSIQPVEKKHFDIIEKRCTK